MSGACLAGAWPTWVIGNHDQPRVATRLGAAQARIAMMLILTLRGTPTLYQGDELGMTDVAIPAASMRDPFAAAGATPRPRPAARADAVVRGLRARLHDRHALASLSRAGPSGSRRRAGGRPCLHALPDQGHPAPAPQGAGAHARRLAGRFGRQRRPRLRAAFRGPIGAASPSTCDRPRRGCRWAGRARWRCPPMALTSRGMPGRSSSLPRTRA